ncbi:hypothetical protein [Candidatus Ichthyocystis hellenicum]|uniref:hypothetical protein n=1 Tax=Candidatus Ichthyocystis hellenicum TaxID=1561003 RepID=UPI001112559C|nr:hypothetical protein [Candidatus Ichthyocystis hellenicum]
MGYVCRFKSCWISEPTSYLSSMCGGLVVLSKSCSSLPRVSITYAVLAATPIYKKATVTYYSLLIPHYVTIELAIEIMQ